MLDEKDLKMIAELLDSKLDSKLNEQTNMILNELDNVQTKFMEKIKRLEENIDELTQYYKINRLENENTSLLLQMIRDLQKEMDEIKKKIA